MFKEFKTFIMRGNVMDLAVGIVIGAAFTTVVNSFVNDLLMPPIGLLLGKVDFANLFFDLSGAHPASVAEAKAKGLPVIAYGAFLNDVISFLIVAFVVFLVIRQINKRKRVEAAAPTKDCPYCLSVIPVNATRCSGCCGELPIS